MFTPPTLLHVICLEYNQAKTSKSPTTNNGHTTTEFLDCNEVKKSKSNLLLLRMVKIANNLPNYWIEIQPEPVSFATKNIQTTYILLSKWNLQPQTMVTPPLSFLIAIKTRRASRISFYQEW